MNPTIHNLVGALAEGDVSRRKHGRGPQVGEIYLNAQHHEIHVHVVDSGEYVGWSVLDGSSRPRNEDGTPAEFAATLKAGGFKYDRRERNS